MHYKDDFVRFLLESGALTFGDFTLKSGRKSPYMVNTGKFDSGVLLSRLGCFYARAIYEKMELGVIPRETTILFGSAYKGIPLASAAAIALAAAFEINIGYAFNRKETKDHGEGGVFVGKKPVAGDRILVIDDVMTAGTALRDTVDLLRLHAPGAKVVGSIIAVDRKEYGRDKRLSSATELQYELGIPIVSIVDINEIVETLKSGGLSDEALFCESSGCKAPMSDASWKGSEAAEKSAATSRRLGISCKICELECDNKLKTALPTREQIASLEAYLESTRPSSEQ